MSHGSVKTPTITPRSNHPWFGRNQVFGSANRINTNENESQKQTQTHHTLHTHFHSLDSLPSVLPYTADRSTPTRRGQSVLNSNWKTTRDAAIATHFQYAKYAFLTQTTHNTVSSSSTSHTHERQICNCEDWPSHSIWDRSSNLSQPSNDRCIVTRRGDNPQLNYYQNDIGRIAYSFCGILQHLQPIDNPSLPQIEGRLKGGE